MRPVGGNEHGFDRVEIKVSTGHVERFTNLEFESLPIDRRVRAILGRQLRFFRGDSEITMREALATRRRNMRDPRPS